MSVAGGSGIRLPGSIPTASPRNRKMIATHPMRLEMTAAVAEVMVAAASAGGIAEKGLFDLE